MSFKGSKPDFLLDLLIVTLNTRAQLGKADELAEADNRRQRQRNLPNSVTLTSRVRTLFTRNADTTDLRGSTTLPASRAHCSF